MARVGMGVAAGFVALAAANLALAQSDIRTVDLADIRVAPRKYADRDIEVRGLRCYYADRNDYRCGSDAGVTLFIKKINDEAARTYVESSCDEVRKVAAGGKCRLTVRLKYSEDDLGEDVQSYGLRRITIDVSEATVLLPRRR